MVAPNKEVLLVKMKSSLRKCYGRHHDSPLWNICVTNNHGYVPLVVSTSQSSPHSSLISGFVTRLTRRVEQELLTLPQHLSSLPVFSRIRVTRSFVLYVFFVDRCLSFCICFFWTLCYLFFFDLWILIDYPFGIFKLFLCIFRKRTRYVVIFFCFKLVQLRREMIVRFVYN